MYSSATLQGVPIMFQPCLGLLADPIEGRGPIVPSQYILPRSQKFPRENQPECKINLAIPVIFILQSFV